MIVTAAFLLGWSYEACHSDHYDPDDIGPGALVLLGVFMYFDYTMAQVIA